MKNGTLKFALLGCFLLVLADSRAEEAGASVPGPLFEDVISLRSVSNPRVSPDGRTVAFTVRTTDWKENRFDSEVWLVREGEDPFQLTRNPDGGSRSPAWSPDGRWLAFLSDQEDKRQLYVIRPYGGESQALTDRDEGISAFKWSPDGGMLAFTGATGKSEEKKRRDERYGEFSVEDQEYENQSLWLINFKPDPVPGPGERPCSRDSAESSASSEDKTDEKSSLCFVLAIPRELVGAKEFTVSSFDWSRDGKQIVFEHRSDPLITSYVSADISIVDVESGTIRSLVEAPGFDGSPQWSPDSRWILYSSAGGNTTSDYYKNGFLFKVVAEGGTPIQLAADIDEEVRGVTWTPAGIYALVSERTARRIYRIDESGSSQVFARSPENIWEIDLSPNGETLVLTGQGPDSLPELFKSHVSAYSPAKLTQSTSQIDSWELGTSEVVSWESRDGTEIEGILYKPKDFTAGRRYPLLVVVHGGPTGRDYRSPVRDYVYPITQWVAKGAIVLRPNYRGSAGYGEAFRSLNVRNLGVGDAWDVLSGVDHLVGRGIVDTDRMGVMGWSQGGYISAFLTTNTDRFSAVSVGAGISNWVTYYVNTDIHPFTRQYLESVPWDDPEIYARTSPMTNIKNARTPTLIQHGEFDRRVPIPNAYELYQGLQDMGVESRLIVYKGFGHGISKPKERLAAIWHNYQWFAKYVWGEEVILPLGVEEE